VCTTGQVLDQAALEKLFARLERPLYNVVYRWLWNPQDAADVVQEAFVRLWRIRATVRLETVDSLLYTIALNQAKKRRRWQRLRRFVGLSDHPLADSTPAADYQLDQHMRAHRVRVAIEALPDPLRDVITLCAISDLTYAEVGDILKIPAGTVGSRRNRALALLRADLGEDVDV
jgi:RNA polymerase sigma-70 factor (ECF subfamily)